MTRAPGPAATDAKAPAPAAQPARRPRAWTMPADVDTDQRAEIRRMRALLAPL